MSDRHPPQAIIARHTGSCSNEATMHIRDESPQDRQAVYRVVSSAFGRSCEAELVGKLRAAGDSVISLVAEEGSQLVGHVLLSRMVAPFHALALAPVSVVPTRQRRGIGSALIREAMSRARSEGWAAIFVLGDPKYYERFDFDRDGAADFQSPYSGPHFMVLKLSPSLPTTTGELRHAPAFAALD
jgi:putative acetyltransferase